MLGVAVGYPRFQILPVAFPVPPLWAFGLSCFLFLRESPCFAVSSAFPPSIPTGGWLVQGPGVGERGVLQRAPVSQASEPVSGVPSGPVQELRPISPLSPNSLPGGNISSLFPQTPSPVDYGL